MSLRSNTDGFTKQLLVYNSGPQYVLEESVKNFKFEF